jgi:glycosyltransferase involved in cell wall biosynthesis
VTIIFYSHTSSIGNGGAESLLDIVKELSKQHICYVMLPTIGSLQTRFESIGVACIISGHKWSSNYNNKLLLNKLGYSYRLIKSWIKKNKQEKIYLQHHIQQVEKLKPDVIYSNSSVINTGIKVANKLNVKHIWHLREFQYLDYKLSPDFGWRNFKKWANKSNIVIVNSQTLGNFYKEYVKESKIKVVYNGFRLEDTIENSTRQELPTLFLMVGILKSYKNHLAAIKAIKVLVDAGYDNIKLDIVGKGDMEEELTSFVQQNNLTSYVEFHGQSNEVNSFYNNAHAYLMCSTVEAFGRVTAEAMLHKLPVIAYSGKYNASKEIISEGIDGFLYSSELELSKKMGWLINNKPQAIKIAENGYRRIVNEFSFSAMINKINTILAETVYN